VGEAHPEMIAIRRDEHLGLVAQPAERNRMDDAIAIALKIVSRTPRFITASEIEPASAFRGIGSIGRVKCHCGAMGAG